MRYVTIVLFAGVTIAACSPSASPDGSSASNANAANRVTGKAFLPMSNGSTGDQWKQAIYRYNCDANGVAANVATPASDADCKAGYYFDGRQIEAGPPQITCGCCVKGRKPSWVTMPNQIVTSFARSTCDTSVAARPGACAAPSWAQNPVYRDGVLVEFTSAPQPTTEVWTSKYGVGVDMYTGNDVRNLCRKTVEDALCLPPAPWRTPTSHAFNAANDKGCLYIASASLAAPTVCTDVANGASCGWRTCNGVGELPCTLSRTDGSAVTMTWRLVDNSQCTASGNGAGRVGNCVGGRVQRGVAAVITQDPTPGFATQQPAAPQEPTAAPDLSKGVVVRFGVDEDGAGNQLLGCLLVDPTLPGECDHTLAVPTETDYDSYADVSICDPYWAANGLTCDQQDVQPSLVFSDYAALEAALEQSTAVSVVQVPEATPTDAPTANGSDDDLSQCPSVPGQSTTCTPNTPTCDANMNWCDSQGTCGGCFGNAGVSCVRGGVGGTCDGNGNCVP